MSTLKVAAVQYDIQWLDKQANLEKLDGLLQGLADRDLILLPETFSTGFSTRIEGCEEDNGGGQVVAWMKGKANRLGAVVAGSVLVQKADAKANRFFWVFPDGEVQYYDKRHLFRLGKEDQHVTAGNSRKIITVKGVRILPQVCYDLRFPVWQRNRQDYDLMINIANWPMPRRNAWDALLVARAIENQVHVIGVNRIGLDGYQVAHDGGTAIIDYSGKTLAAASDNESCVIKAELDFARQKEFIESLPFYLDADNFEIR